MSRVRAASWPSKNIRFDQLLVNVERDSRDLERSALGLPGPLKGGIEMRVIGVDLLADVPVRLRRDKTDGRIVDRFFSR